MTIKTRLLLFCLLAGNTVFAIDKDSNVVISAAKETYQFEYNKKKGDVDILQKTSTTYLCNNFRVSIPVVEFYNDKTSIDEVKIYVDGDKANKTIKPEYSYYSVDDIFYSDARICYFKLPLEKKGSNSEVVFEKTLSDPRYFTSIYFSESYAVKSKEVVITVPKWMKAEFKEMNFDGFDIRKSVVYNSGMDADIITYSIKNLPLRESESHSPGPSYTQPHLMVLCKEAATADKKITYFNTLADQYAWYRQLTKEPGNNTAVLKAKALEITSGLTTEMAKIKAVLYWMHNNIRYVAFEDGIAGFKPEKADEVLRKKYGDCKGMAHLTKELLVSLGFDARLCWIGTNHIAYNYSTPSMAVDNHMICALIYQGKTYFLDATENYLPFNEYAERIQGRQVLIEDGDKYIYTKVPATTYQQNLDAEKVTLAIKGTDVEGAVTRSWKGEEEEYVLSGLNNIKKEKSTDAFMRYLSSGNTDYQLASFVTSDVDDYDKELTVSYKLVHKNAVTSFGKEMFVDIDYRKEFDDFTFDIKERENDYWFSYKTNLQREVVLDVPVGYAVTAAPPNLAIQNADYDFTASIVQKEGKIFYKKNITIKNPHLAKAKFVQWNNDIAKLKAFYNEQIVLTQK